MDGNLMILPRKHIENLEDLNAEQWKEFSKVLLETKKKLEKIFKTKDFNIGLNLGEKSGGSIRHLHWQIIPRPVTTSVNSANIFGDIHIITVHPKELRDLMEGNKKV